MSQENEEEPKPRIPTTKEEVGALWEAAPAETKAAGHLFLEMGLTIHDLDRVLKAKSENESE